MVAAATFVTSGGNADASSGTTSPTYSRPTTSITQGSTVLVWVLWTTVAYAATPSGWTLHDQNIETIGTQVFRINIFWKVVGASEPTTYTTTAASSTRWGGHIFAVNDVDTTFPLGYVERMSQGTATASITQYNVHRAYSGQTRISSWIKGTPGTGVFNSTPTTGWTNLSGAAFGSGNDNKCGLAYKSNTGSSVDEDFSQLANAWGLTGDTSSTWATVCFVVNSNKVIEKWVKNTSTTVLQSSFLKNASGWTSLVAEVWGTGGWGSITTSAEGGGGGGGYSRGSATITVGTSITYSLGPVSTSQGATTFINIGTTSPTNSLEAGAGGWGQNGGSTGGTGAGAIVGSNFTSQATGTGGNGATGQGGGGSRAGSGGGESSGPVAGGTQTGAAGGAGSSNIPGTGGGVGTEPGLGLGGSGGVSGAVGGNGQFPGGGGGGGGNSGGNYGTPGGSQARMILTNTITGIQYNQSASATGSPATAVLGFLTKSPAASTTPTKSLLRPTSKLLQKIVTPTTTITKSTLKGPRSIIVYDNTPAEFSASPWVGVSTTATDPSVAGPGNSGSATLLTASATGTQFTLNYPQSASINDAQALKRRIIFRAKAGTTPYVYFYGGYSSIWGYQISSFDLSNATVGSSLYDATIRPLGDGWCEITVTAGYNPGANNYGVTNLFGIGLSDALSGTTVASGKTAYIYDLTAFDLEVGGGLIASSTTAPSTYRTFPGTINSSSSLSSDLLKLKSFGVIATSLVSTITSLAKPSTKSILKTINAAGTKFTQIPKLITSISGNSSSRLNSIIRLLSSNSTTVTTRLNSILHQTPTNISLVGSIVRSSLLTRRLATSPLSVTSRVASMARSISSNASAVSSRISQSAKSFLVNAAPLSSRLNSTLRSIAINASPLGQLVRSILVTCVIATAPLSSKISSLSKAINVNVTLTTSRILQIGKTALVNSASLTSRLLSSTKIVLNNSSPLGSLSRSPSIARIFLANAAQTTSTALLKSLSQAFTTVSNLQAALVRTIPISITRAINLVPGLIRSIAKVISIRRISSLNTPTRIISSSNATGASTSNLEVQD